MDITGNFSERSERIAAEKAIIVSGKKIYYISISISISLSYYIHTITHTHNVVRNMNVKGASLEVSGGNKEPVIVHWRKSDHCYKMTDSLSKLCATFCGK